MRFFVVVVFVSELDVKLGALFGIRENDRPATGKQSDGALENRPPIDVATRWRDGARCWFSLPHARRSRVAPAGFPDRTEPPFVVPRLAHTHDVERRAGPRPRRDARVLHRIASSPIATRAIGPPIRTGRGPPRRVGHRPARPRLRGGRGRDGTRDGTRGRAVRAAPPRTFGVSLRGRFRDDRQREDGPARAPRL